MAQTKSNADLSCMEQGARRRGGTTTTKNLGIAPAAGFEPPTTHPPEMPAPPAAYAPPAPPPAPAAGIAPLGRGMGPDACMMARTRWPSDSVTSAKSAKSDKDRFCV